MAEDITLKKKKGFIANFNEPAAFAATLVPAWGLSCLLTPRSASVLLTSRLAAVPLDSLPSRLGAWASSHSLIVMN